jgi:hypothetical protein
MGKKDASDCASDAGQIAAESKEETSASSLAGYIAELTAELAHMAERSQMPMLAHFLNLARVEAEYRSRESEPPRAGGARS